MLTQKFFHSCVFLTLEIICILSCIGFYIAIYYLIQDSRIEGFSLVTLLIAIAMFTLFTYKLARPAFTTITFQESNIESQYCSNWSVLDVSEIKGIWFYKEASKAGFQVSNYSPGVELPKGCTIIIGDLKATEGANFIVLSGGDGNILRSTFGDGYTTISFRQNLIPILDNYYNQIQARQSDLM